MFTSSCMDSMDVKLSPIQVESRCEILEVEETPIEVGGGGSLGLLLVE